MLGTREITEQSHFRSDIPACYPAQEVGWFEPLWAVNRGVAKLGAEAVLNDGAIALATLWAGIDSTVAAVALISWEFGHVVSQRRAREQAQR